MELRDTPDEAAFRAELRAWLDASLPEGRRGGRGGAQRFDDSFGREWSRMLYDAGYAGLTWPKEYGGAGAPYSFQAIFYEEMARAQAPAHVGVIGLGMAGPTIIAHGNRFTRDHTASGQRWWHPSRLCKAHFLLRLKRDILNHAGSWGFLAVPRRSSRDWRNVSLCKV